MVRNRIDQAACEVSAVDVWVLDVGPVADCELSLDSIEEDAEQLDLWLRSVGAGFDSDFDVDPVTEEGEVGGSVDVTSVVEDDVLHAADPSQRSKRRLPIATLSDPHRKVPGDLGHSGRAVPERS